VEDIVGGTADDRLVGSDAENVIVAGRGDDRVSAGRGADIVFGNQGSDILSSGPPRDDGAVDQVSGAGILSDDGEATVDACGTSALNGDVEKFCDQ
jgi:Ca2+-binding RTX toxin-like protein